MLQPDPLGEELFLKILDLFGTSSSERPYSIYLFIFETVDLRDKLSQTHKYTQSKRYIYIFGSLNDAMVYKCSICDIKSK